MWVVPLTGYLRCGGVVEDTPSWVGISGQHGTESWGICDNLELVCIEAVLSRGREPGIHIRAVNE